MNRNAHNKAVGKYGKSYTDQADKLKFKNTMTAETMKAFDPRFKFFRARTFSDYIPNGIKNYGASVSSAWKAGGLGYLRAGWKAMVIPAYGYIVANEVRFFSYTTPDFMFENHVQREKPLPELKTDESAVLFIGLDEADLLYAGAQSNDYQRNLRAKYGKQFYVVTFDSPDDFFRKLEIHAEEHGRIKYLKVVTHGIPGMLATKAIEKSPVLSENFDHFDERGFISIKMLKQNEKTIMTKSKKFMAKDAQVMLVSCLVGANYQDFEKDFPDEQGADDIGDQFLDQFAKVMLPHYGRLDASTRALIGMDMIYMSLLLHEPLAKMLKEQNKRQGIIPLTRYNKNPNTGLFERVSLDEDNSIEEWPEPEFDIRKMKLPFPSQIGLNNELYYTSKRLAGIITNFSEITRRYGVSLENNGLWDERYKTRIVEPE